MAFVRAKHKVYGEITVHENWVKQWPDLFKLVSDDEVPPPATPGDTDETPAKPAGKRTPSGARATEKKN